MNNIFEDIGLYVYLNKDGSVVYDSRFKKQFSGDLDLLHSCIEDNIYWNDEFDCEEIDWDAVIEEYEEYEEYK